MARELFLFDQSESLPARSRLIGMDEAGYGPNLGPLLLAVTSWELPGEPAEFDFYAELAPVVSRSGHEKGRCLHLADSKQVYVGKSGFESLERSALAIMECAGQPVNSLFELWHALSGVNLQQRSGLAGWYQEDLELPVKAKRSQVDDLSGKLQERLQAVEVSLDVAKADVVVETRFNQLANAPGSNKSQALSQLAFTLLRSVWNPADSTKTLFVGDKHGGRNRYDELLAPYLGGEFISRLEEGTAISRYQVARTELRFQMRGEEHLPVACASILAKYLRELFMDQFNQFWLQQCTQHRALDPSTFKPTRGYPQDARRFRQEIESLREQLEIPESQFWRVR